MLCSKIFDIDPNPEKRELFKDKSKYWYSNESFMIYNRKIIFTLKKQIFHREMIITDQNNFCLGFGQQKTNLLKNEPEYKLYEFLWSKIDIEICRDIQKEYNYHRKAFMRNNIMGFNYKFKEQI